MRIARWLLWQVLVFPASLLFVLAALGIFLLSLVEPGARIVALWLRGKEIGEWQRRRLRDTPRSSWAFCVLALKSVMVAHSARAGEF